MLSQAKVVKHSISIQYVCPSNGTSHTVKIESPYIDKGAYFEDWTYTFIEFKCKFCGDRHKFEI